MRSTTLVSASASAVSRQEMSLPLTTAAPVHVTALPVQLQAHLMAETADANVPETDDATLISGSSWPYYGY
ncbi:hypothetical protein [Streptomyces uncialis]|uniref:hypothetical protein n=1 Tax=Streptomyces uncialis TaxID=1048205 RepID=UPI00386376DB|nr:hypothetical protein OG268_05945 [Streptomyces uncialis]